MVGRDARSLPQSAQEELRRRALALVSSGEKQVRVAELLNVTPQAVGKWVRAHREGGDQALAAGKRGRRFGEKTVLEWAQQAQIAEAISEKTPDQLQLPGFLWTRASVCDLIEQRFEIRMAEKTAGAYLRRWGFTPRAPVKPSDEQSDPKVRAWLDHTYPQIVKQARKERAEILWGGETALRSDHAPGTSPAGAGRRGHRQGHTTNVISVVSNLGVLRFRAFQERFTGPMFLDFVERLVKQNAGRKTYLIVDGRPAHRARLVRDWVSERPELIALHVLPSSSATSPPALRDEPTAQHNHNYLQDENRTYAERPFAGRKHVC